MTNLMETPSPPVFSPPQPLSPDTPTANSLRSQLFLYFAPTHRGAQKGQESLPVFPNFTQMESHPMSFSAVLFPQREFLKQILLC